MKGKSEEAREWKFFNAGGNCQVLIENSGDLANIGSLDKKLWAALSCPSSGLAIDPQTLAFLDADSDGFIRHDELAAACEWICKMLKDAGSVFDGSDSLDVGNINADTPDGKKAAGAARRILECLGRPEGRTLCVSDFADRTKIYAATAFNADGVITAASAQGDEKLAALIGDIASVSGSKPDRSGAEGVDAAAVEDFYAQMSAWQEWRALPQESFEGRSLSEAAFGAFRKVEEKIDDYFTRAQLLKFDSDALESVNPSPERLAEILSNPVSEGAAQLERLPVSRVTGMSLELGDNINPMWSAFVAEFNSTAVAEVFGRTCGSLTFADWRKIKAAYAGYAAWAERRPKVKICELGEDRIAEISASDFRRKLSELFERESAAAPDIENIGNVEKLVRLNANLAEVLENFVNFKRFYDGAPAAFQCGKLYVDRRVCEFCVRVDDAKKHELFAPFSGIYLLYCTCRRAGQPDMSIAAAVTAGDCDNLMVGRNGVFYDRDGRDWQATVTAIVSNPISVGQAFFSPYKRLLKWVTEQISKRAALADKSVDESLTSAEAPKAAKKIDVGTVAALGVAVSGFTAVFGILLDRIFSLGMWLPVGILGVVLAISLPSMIIAGMKLRMRNLAPLLDANGWAVNTKAKISISFGSRLTNLAPVPSSPKYWIAAVLILSLALGIGAALCVSMTGRQADSKQAGGNPPAQACASGEVSAGAPAGDLAGASARAAEKASEKTPARAGTPAPASGAQAAK